jgi:hypothetical protein
MEKQVTTCPNCNHTENNHITLCPNCGAILDDSFASDIKQNKSSKFPRVPVWVSVVIVIIICGYLGFLSYKSKEKYDQKQEINLAEFNLSMITEDSVKSVAVHPREKTRCLTKQYQNEFIKLARKMPPAQYLGLHMNYYRGIDIDAGDVGKFHLDVYTRGQDVHASFSRFGDRERSLVVYYDGVDLFEWLENLPNNAFQDCPASLK